MTIGEKNPRVYNLRKNLGKEVEALIGEPCIGRLFVRGTLSFGTSNKGKDFLELGIDSPGGDKTLGYYILLKNNPIALRIFKREVTDINEINKKTTIQIRPNQFTFTIKDERYGVDPILKMILYD